MSVAAASAQDFVLALAEDLNSGELELPAFPDAVVRVQRAMQSENVDTDEVVRIISSDPALAARVLQIANSAAVRSSASEITDVRRAVVHMGFRLVQSSVVSFALRQTARNKSMSTEAKDEFKSIWRDSLDSAATCHVIAKKFTDLNADEAMLTGLLSVMGRLYIFMKSQQQPAIDDTELRDIVNEWHPAIGKAIAESWGMSEELATAIEHQLEIESPFKGPTTLTDVLLASRLVNQARISGETLYVDLLPVLVRAGLCAEGDQELDVEQYEADISEVHAALSG